MKKEKELIAKVTYDQRSHGIVHVRHLYESHFPVLREELEGFHGEAVLGECILDLFLRYRSPRKSKLNVAKPSGEECGAKYAGVVDGLLTECWINAGSRSADRYFDNSSSRVS